MDKLEIWLLKENKVYMTSTWCNANLSKAWTGHVLVYVFNARLVGVYAPARLSTRPRVAGKARPGIIVWFTCFRRTRLRWAVDCSLGWMSTHKAENQLHSSQVAPPKLGSAWNRFHSHFCRARPRDCFWACLVARMSSSQARRVQVQSVWLRVWFFGVQRLRWQ